MIKIVCILEGPSFRLGVLAGLLLAIATYTLGRLFGHFLGYLL